MHDDISNIALDNAVIYTHKYIPDRYIYIYMTYSKGNNLVSATSRLVIDDHPASFVHFGGPRDG